MPNHITNILRVKGSEKAVKAFFESIKGEDTIFDFNKVTPMPAELNIESSSDGDYGMKYLLYKSNSELKEYADTYEMVEKLPDERKDKVIELGRIYLSNIKKYGYTNWYDWCLANWGTKWNAYETEMIDDYTLQFLTAWSGVPNLIQKLSLKFPKIEFEYIYADEDAGYNTGKGTFIDGKSEMFYPKDGSKESFEIYFETHEWAIDDYELVNGKWIYKED